MLAFASIYTFFPLIPLFYRQKLCKQYFTDLYFLAALCLLLLIIIKLIFGIKTDLKFIIPILLIVIFYPTKFINYNINNLKLSKFSLLDVFIVITIISICWAMANEGMFWQIKRDIWKEAGIFTTNNVIAYFLTCTFLVANFKNRTNRFFYTFVILVLLYILDARASLLAFVICLIPIKLLIMTVFVFGFFFLNSPFFDFYLLSSKGQILAAAFDNFKYDYQNNFLKFVFGGSSSTPEMGERLGVTRVADHTTYYSPHISFVKLYLGSGLIGLFLGLLIYAKMFSQNAALAVLTIVTGLAGLPVYPFFPIMLLKYKNEQEIFNNR